MRVVNFRGRTGEDFIRAIAAHFHSSYSLSRCWLGQVIAFWAAAMPTGGECARNRLSAMGASPICTDGALRSVVMIVSEQRQSGFIGAVIENPQFRESRSEGNFATQGRDVLISNSRSDAMTIQDRFAVPDFVKGRM